MNKKKVLVLGTGFAGQGHAKAFSDAGAEIVGIVGRIESVVTEVAEKMAIPYAGTDWQAALESCQPDVVSIATPGGAHYEPVLQALNAGCHVFCDKPLATNGDEAKEMMELAEQKGLKTAFASSFRFMPEIIHARRLIQAGRIGEPREVELISHFNLDKNIPFGWSHTIDAGGGRLNNNFTHLLSIVTYTIGESILAISGDIRKDLARAPKVSGVHNFTERRNFIPEDLNDPNLEWGESDVEWSYTVMAKVKADTYPAEKPVSVLFKHGGLVPRFNEDHIVFHGSEGSIYIKGHYGAGPLYLWGESKEWQELPLPQDINEMLPQIKDDTQRSWTYLARLLINDLNGVPDEPYQTFKDGYRYQRMIDIVRESDNWVDTSDL
jgi:predicted dehydrogenase